MPSYFRSARDVRIVFAGEVETPEDRKQQKRLLTLFKQSVRRAGGRGNFFFQRKATSLGGAPILILEPQGPIDRGIFQDGISRFGETLTGTFHTPKPGYLVLEPKANVPDSSVRKYSRDIRRIVARFTGMMGSGGDDRVTIITPKEKARRARAEAAARREEASQAREALHAEREARAAAREEKAPRREQEAPSPTPAPEGPTPAERAERQVREQAQRAATQQAGVALIDAQWRDQLITWSHAASDSDELEAERVEAEARIAALEAHEALTNHLKHRLAAVDDARALGPLLSELEGEPVLDELLEMLEFSEAPVETAQAWVQQVQLSLQAARAERQPDIERVREIHRTLTSSRSQMERSRRDAVRSQAEAIRGAVRTHNQAASAARQAGDEAAARAAEQELVVAQAALAVISRVQRADDTLKWISASLGRMAERGETSQEDFDRQAKVDFSLRQSLSQLGVEVKALRQLGAEGLLGALWESRPEIAWARPMLEAAVG